LKLYHEEVKYYWLHVHDAETFLLDVTNVIHKTLTLQLCHTKLQLLRAMNVNGNKNT